MPLGFNYEEEVEEDGFKYDKELWDNFQKFMPAGVVIPEREDPTAAEAAYSTGQVHIPGGPGWVAPPPESESAKKVQ